MKERKEWCLKQAQEFVENKLKNRCYPFRVSFDGDVHTQYFVLDAEDEKMVRENPSELMDCSVDWSKYIQLPNEFYDGVPACVLSADMNQSAGKYTFTIHKNYAGEEKCVIRDVQLVLTNEQYVRLLALLLEDPEMGFGIVAFKDVELYKDVARQIFGCGAEVAVFMTELQKDAKAVMETKL